MEQHDRNKIDRCVDSMMETMDMTVLWPWLLKYGIYNKDHINVPMWEKSLNDRKTVKDILLSIKTRGPSAYQNFIKCLSKVNYINLIDMLENKRMPLAENNNLQIGDNRKKIDSNVAELWNPAKAEAPVKIVVKKSTTFRNSSENNLIHCYPMTSSPRGLCLLITLIDYEGNSHRAAAEHDERSLRDLFQQMGFKTFSYKDLTADEIRSTVENFARNEGFRNVHSSFVIISAHGIWSDSLSQTIILDKKGAGVTDGEIISYFAADRCEHLRDKPKVFVFQMCRGGNKQKVVHMTDRNKNGDHKFMFEFDEASEAPKSMPLQRKIVVDDKTVRNYSDILVAHSTIPGDVSFRDKITGTWYIQLLCLVFMEHAHEFHVQDLLLMTDHRLDTLRTDEQYCQTSITRYIGFFKHLFLNPGL